MQQIQQLSRIISGLLTVFFWLTPLLTTSMWLYAPYSFETLDHAIKVSLIPAHLPLLHPLTWHDRLLGIAISSLPVATGMLILHHLIALFSRYASGQLYTRSNARHIHRIAITLLTWVLVLQFPYQAALTSAITWHNPMGHRVVAISLNKNDILMALIGVITLILAKIMLIGAKLQEEQHRFI